MDAASPLAGARDRHLFGPGPKRLLALDGGGVRGVITVAFLERIEAVLAEHTGGPVRLGDWFDLVGGTSTGAVIAGALALGHTTEDLKHFYLRLAPRVFRRPFWRVMGLQAKFDARALRYEIEQVVGARTLDSEDLVTGLCVVTKRMDTGSPWIVANNPRGPYWETPADRAYIGNRHYRLTNLVRASTAAPVYFDPELLPIVDGVNGLFVDGGVTPHQTPALAVFLMTQLKAYGLCWPTGPDRLLAVSIGTGTYRNRLTLGETRYIGPIGLAIRALSALISDGSGLVLALMQWLGECPAPWQINSEVGDLRNDGLAGGKLFRFLRYDVTLDATWLAETLGIKLSPRDVNRVRRMDDPVAIPLAYEIGRRAAERQVKLEHLLSAPPVV
jgi:patatin-like phospholipase